MPTNALALDHGWRAQQPGYPEYASNALAGLFPTGADMASASGIPILADAADTALTIDAMRRGQYGEAGLNALMALLPFVGVGTLRSGQKIGRSLGRRRLYRASDDNFVRAGTSFAKDLDSAKEYMNNPGFGGQNLYSAEVDMNNVLDLTNRRDNWDELSSALGREVDPQNYAYHFARAVTYDDDIVDELAQRGYDWIAIEDDFPVGSITYIPASDIAVDAIDDAIESL